MESSLEQKTSALLGFLKNIATLRRKRHPAYATGDRVLWFDNVPADRPECRSAFFADNPTEFPDLWLEVRKKRMPPRPSVPEIVQDWVRPQDLNQVDEEPVLLPEITILVEREFPDPESPAETPRTIKEKVPELRRLTDHPEVEEAWLEYFVDHWEPWATEMRRWNEVQRIYEDVDFMRRRLEEAEERYELIMAVGLLQWRDPAGSTVRRHLLTAPAEITLDAARGVLTAGPAASFEKFRVELDMLELQNQPRLEGAGVDDLLEELDVQVWDRTEVGKILGVIANRASADSQLDESGLKPLERADGMFRVVYAPALVLRERRPTAYEELVNRFVKISERGASLPITGPWQRFVREGEPSTGPALGQPHDDVGAGDTGGRLYFPLPTNEEQRRIADRVKCQPYVLVKGPPGTGKSHTIANLICHLLAEGDRILVSAHAPKALTVLRGLLPGDIRNLCVTAFGSTREDQRLLEDSVRGILWRKNEWNGDKWAQDKIAEVERKLHKFEDRSSQVERGLRECREAETHSHTLLGGYQGTAAQVARQVEGERNKYDWFPELSDAQSRCPLQLAEINLLAEVHGALTEDRVRDLRLDLGNNSLPCPEEFEGAIAKLKGTEQRAESACREVSQEQLDRLQAFDDEALETSKVFLTKLEKCVTRASRTLGQLADEVIKDLLVGSEARWNRLAQDMAALVRSIHVACERVGAAQVDLPVNANPHLLVDVRRRLDHFKRGGRRGVGFLAPREVRETRYVEEHCRVNGKAPRDLKSLEVLKAFLELKVLIEQFSKIWPGPTPLVQPDPERAARDVEDSVQELNRPLELFRTHGADDLEVIPVRKRTDLAESNECVKWLRLIEANLAIRQARKAREPIERWLQLIRSIPDETVHPCMQQLAQAIEDCGVENWRNAWETRERLKEEKERLLSYERLVEQLEQSCPGLKNILASTQGLTEWKGRLLQLEDAWNWSAASAWLRKVSDEDTYRRLSEERHRLQGRIEKTLEELATLKAWQAFFSRLDDPTEANLSAWTKAVARIGKGTGKYAYRNRRTARRYLMACIPTIPAWIMPLHKVWETANAEPGLFDTVIIDEASQAGIESLALLLLAKRIIVVGDDKQNSPEAVGVLEDDIARLARDHLREFKFRDEFRPDTSLFDHTERSFGNLISLREHFRCVPEIIRFSNELCYTDAPLIPLRQPPPNRLQPLRATFVDMGACEGERQRIINRAEVEKIVETILSCLGDESYEGKTMGVIVLQGHSQGELIEKKLAEVLDPKVREDRKLRCGVSATFQGDQRDVIFLSLVVAPNYGFRALAGLADQRRFNVAMSRARDQVWLFHSVQQHDLNREDLRWRILNFFYSPGQEAQEELYEELNHLEREVRRSPRQLGEQPGPYESWFEVDVAVELLRRKYKVRPQYEVASKRIDLVIEGLENRLAVECYGDAWHGPDRYEQDQTRQRQLERAGWTFVIIRESEFYANRSRAVDEVIEECDRLGIRRVDQVEESVSEESIPEEDFGLAQTTIIDGNDLTTKDNIQAKSTASPGKDLSVRTGPYTGYSALGGFPDPREASPANVRAALHQIIEKDGPLSKASIFRLYVEGCPALNRAGKAVRSALNKALWTMQKADDIVVEDELGDRSLQGQIVRLASAPKIRERSADRRDFLEIPPSELLLVIDRVSSSPAGDVEDEKTIARNLIDHYGFTRLTEVRRKYLDRILGIRRKKRSK